MSQVIDVFVSIVVLGASALIATFFIVLNKYKDIIWDCIELKEDSYE